EHFRNYMTHRACRRIVRHPNVHERRSIIRWREANQSRMTNALPLERFPADHLVMHELCGHRIPAHRNTGGAIHYPVGALVPTDGSGPLHFSNVSHPLRPALELGEMAEYLLYRRTNREGLMYSYRVPIVRGFPRTVSPATLQRRNTKGRFVRLKPVVHTAHSANALHS